MIALRCRPILSRADPRGRALGRDIVLVRALVDAKPDGPRGCRLIPAGQSWGGKRWPHHRSSSQRQSSWCQQAAADQRLDGGEDARSNKSKLFNNIIVILITFIINALTSFRDSFDIIVLTKYFCPYIMQLSMYYFEAQASF